MPLYRLVEYDENFNSVFDKNEFFKMRKLWFYINNIDYKYKFDKYFEYCINLYKNKHLIDLSKIKRMELNLNGKINYLNSKFSQFYDIFYSDDMFYIDHNDEYLKLRKRFRKIYKKFFNYYKDEKYDHQKSNNYLVIFKKLYLPTFINLNTNSIEELSMANFEDIIYSNFIIENGLEDLNLLRYSMIFEILKNEDENLCQKN